MGYPDRPIGILVARVISSWEVGERCRVPVGVGALILIRPLATGVHRATTKRVLELGSSR